MDYNYEALDLDNKIMDKLNRLEISHRKDSLTGLWNQIYFSEQVNNYVGGERNAGNLFVIDIDNFVDVNSEYGHIMGDAYLVNLAGVIKNSFREQDITSRFSGDVFGIFIPGELTYKDIEHISVKLMKAAEESFKSMNIETKASISIGVSRAPSNGSDFLTLYRKADKALRKAKQDGKNCYRLVEEASEAGKKVVTEADMKIVKDLISERNEPMGAFQVEYDGFTSIYRFISRFCDRQNTNLDILLFTITKKDGSGFDPVTLSEAMYALENSIKVSLRMRDVSTKYSSCQYLVMVVGSKDSKSSFIAERVVRNYERHAKKYGVVLRYDVDRVNNDL